MFKLYKNELRVLECIVGIGIYKLKMADTGNDTRITYMVTDTKHAPE